MRFKVVEEPQETVILAVDAADDAVRRMLGLYDAPAYMRRALRMEAAQAALLERCRNQRSAWLASVRRHWAAWQTLVHNDPGLEENLSGAARAALQELRAQLDDDGLPSWAKWPRPAAALASLSAGIERFNRRWRTFLETLDLRPVNELIEGYNRHYLIEKECVVGSPRVASHGFIPLPFVSPRQLLDLWPPLPEIRL